MPKRNARQETMKVFVLSCLYRTPMKYSVLRSHDVHRGELRVTLRGLSKEGLIAGWKDKVFDSIVCLTVKGETYMEQVVLL